MGITAIEKVIFSELRAVMKNDKLRLKDIMEWSTGPVKAHKGEKLYFLPDLQINVAVKEI